MTELRKLTADERAEIDSVRWWHRIPVGLNEDGSIFYTPGEVNHGEDGGDWPTSRFGLPDDLSNKSVLDIGAWDGFFSFEAEKRGAKPVLAVDEPDPRRYGGSEGFELARDLRGSYVQQHEFDIEEASSYIADTPFDLVLCYGVLYHVKNPLRCIENLFVLTAPGGTCLIESARDPDNILANYRAWSLLPGHEGDPTNYWYPTVPGLVQALELAGFIDCTLIYDDGRRITMRAERPQGSARNIPLNIQVENQSAEISPVGEPAATTADTESE